MNYKYLCMVDGIPMTLTKIEVLQYCACKIPIQIISKEQEK